MSVNFSSGNLSRGLNVPGPKNSTLILWVFLPSAPGGDWTLISIDNGTTNYIQISRASTNLALWSDSDGLGHTIVSESSALGNWLAIAMVCGTTTTTLYYSFDGSGSISNITTGSSGGTSSLTLWISNDGFVDGNWPGDILGVKVWDAQLTSTEVQTEFTQIAPVRTSNINTFLPLLNASSPSPTADQSGNGFNLNLNGTLSTVNNTPNIPWVILPDSFSVSDSVTADKPGGGGVLYNRSNSTISPFLD